MNKRQAKKASKKVTIPFADELNLLTLNNEEYKQAMKDYDDYVQKHCRYRHYRDKYRPVPAYHFPVGESVRKMNEMALKTCRGYECSMQTVTQSTEDLKNMYGEQYDKVMNQIPENKEKEEGCL